MERRGRGKKRGGARGRGTEIYPWALLSYVCSVLHRCWVTQKCNQSGCPWTMHSCRNNPRSRSDLAQSTQLLRIYTHAHTRTHTHRRLPAFVATASSRRTEGMLERGIGAEGWRGNKRTTNLFCLLLRARLKINEVGVEGAINDGGNSCRVV